MFQHMKENSKQKDIYLDSVNGYEDHAHCLISLGREQCISKVAQLIKGESSYWINKSGLLQHKFMWQDDYWAVGVSESHASNVRQYIFNQEIHHTKQKFEKEINNFMEKYNWTLIKDKT